MFVLARFHATGQTSTSLNYFLLGILHILQIFHDSCQAILEELCLSAKPVPDARVHCFCSRNFHPVHSNVLVTAVKNVCRFDPTNTEKNELTFFFSQELLFRNSTHLLPAYCFQALKCVNTQDVVPPPLTPSAHCSHLELCHHLLCFLL